MHLSRNNRILSIFGTRPEAIKMVPVLKELRRHPDRVESVVCVTGQHRTILDQVLGPFDIQPDLDLDLMRPNQSLAWLTGASVRKLSRVVEEVRPDCVLVQGDTTTAMAGALVAFYQRIPVGHVEAGLRTGNIYGPFPEEVNRKIITAVAHYNFAPTERAVEALLSEGVSPSRIFLTGNTVVDAVLHVSQRCEGPNPVYPLKPGQRLILVTAHRRESFGEPMERIFRAVLEIVASHPDVIVVCPVHPNPNVRGPAAQMLGNNPRVLLVPPLPYRDLIHVIKDCHIILTDSGGIQEEAPSLGVPVLVLREQTERPEAIDAGTAKLVGTSTSAIVREAEVLLRNAGAHAAMAGKSNPFGDGKAAARIVECLLRAL